MSGIGIEIEALDRISSATRAARFGVKMVRQRTIREKVCDTGIGLHSGKPIRLEIFPALDGEGITFVRSDLPGHAEIKACIENVADTTLATTLAAGVNGSRATIATVEHLMAAFAGLGIDNARVLVDGPELPVFDGSARPFVEMLLRAGIEEQREGKRYLVIKREVCVEEDGKSARIVPGDGLDVTCSVDFDHPLIPPTPFRAKLSERVFQREVAAARTFGFLKDVELLRSKGLALGGSLENAVVIDGYRVLNPEGLRFPDEFVRHKMLDAIGDLSLLGAPIIGKLHLHRSGHALNTKLATAILSNRRNYEMVTASVPRPAHEQPTFSVFEPVESWSAAL